MDEILKSDSFDENFQLLYPLFFNISEVAVKKELPLPQGL